MSEIKFSHLLWAIAYFLTRIKPCFVEQYCRNWGKRREVLRHKCQNYNPVLLRVAAKSDELKLNYLVRFIQSFSMLHKQAELIWCYKEPCLNLSLFLLRILEVLDTRLDNVANSWSSDFCMTPVKSLIKVCIFRFCFLSLHTHYITQTYNLYYSFC